MRLILVLALIWLGNSPLQAAIPVDLQQEIESSQLYRSNHWLKLLHFRNHQSEIDDPRFFLAKDGKTNPQAELLASVEQLIEDRSDTADSRFCLFISRSSWLLEQLPSLRKHIIIPACTALNKELADLKAHRVTLILASAHINSPASAFGHTFLRIDSAESTPLISYAVSYAAETDESNGFIYAFRGIFGGYIGKYSILPYYEKIKEYNDLEQRDIWEYPLNLTPAEIHTMALHILEIRNFTADYFFFLENCSYNILWLLEIARDGLDLTDQFSFNTIPIDTLRVVNAADLIAREDYRPSMRKNIQVMIKQLSDQKALQFAASDDYDLALLQDLSLQQKILALGLSIELLKIRRNDHAIQPGEYTRLLLKLLRERSKLGLQPSVEVPRPVSPLDGHFSNRLSLAVLHSRDEGDSLQIGLKPAYHDSIDIESGYLEGAFISFVDTTLSVSSERTRLESMKIVDIQSLALPDKIFSPVSWLAAFGLERPFNNELHTYLRAGVGKAWGKPELYGYVMLAPGVYYERDWISSVSYRAGLMANGRKLKLGLELERENFNSDQDVTGLQLFLTYALSKNLAAHVSWSSESIEDDAMASRDQDETLLISTMFYF